MFFDIMSDLYVTGISGLTGNQRCHTAKQLPRTFRVQAVLTNSVLITRRLSTSVRPAYIHELFGLNTDTDKALNQFLLCSAAAACVF